MAPDGSGQVNVSPDLSSSDLAFPNWSSDGSKLIFNSIEEGQGEILERPSDGSGSSTYLDTNLSDDLHPVYRPGATDGAFVWSSDRDGDNDIYYATPGTVGAPKNLTNNIDNDTAPTFSPDGTKVIFASADGSDRDIFSVSIDNDGDPTSAPTNISQEQAGVTPQVEDNPEFSPDGTKIAFDAALGGNTNIFVMDVASKARTPITSGPEFEADPTWSPDGARLAYVKDVGNAEIFVINATAGATGTNITNNTAADREPDWSPDLGSSVSRSYSGSVKWFLALPLLLGGPLFGRLRKRKNARARPA
jgi:TolB protein